MTGIKSMGYLPILTVACVILLLLGIYLADSWMNIQNKMIIPSSVDMKITAHNNSLVKRHFSAEQINMFKHNYSRQDDPDLLDYIRQTYLVMPSNLPSKLKKPSMDYSQVGQSIFVDTLLGEKENGFFVECGAANGMDVSNSAYFELKRKWTGLLIEANSGLFKSLLSVHRNAYSINVGLSIQNQSSSFPFRGVGLLGGIDGEMEKIHESFVKKQYGNTKAHQVQCFTLYTLMLAVGRQRIDYFSLDIEGAELKVLKTIPFDKLYIDVLSIEYKAWGGKSDVKSSLKKLLELRQFFKMTGLYREVGILPFREGANQTQIEQGGLDVIFQRI